MSLRRKTGLSSASLCAECLSASWSRLGCRDARVTAFPTRPAGGPAAWSKSPSHGCSRCLRTPDPQPSLCPPHCPRAPPPIPISPNCPHVPPPGGPCVIPSHTRGNCQQPHSGLWAPRGQGPVCPITAGGQSGQVWQVTGPQPPGQTQGSSAWGVLTGPPRESQEPRVVCQSGRLGPPVPATGAAGQQSTLGAPTRSCRPGHWLPRRPASRPCH